MKHLFGIAILCVLMKLVVVEVLVPDTERRRAEAEQVASSPVTEQSFAEQRTRQEMEPVKLAPVAHVSGLTEAECFAQTIFSEDNLEQPRRVLAWTIRNRVEMGVRGNTYCEVTRSPSQYSAISRTNDPGYERVRDVPHQWREWLRSPEYKVRLRAQSYLEALELAEAVMIANPILNPVPEGTHILALGALRRVPSWAYGKVADYTIREQGSKEIRWAIYKHQTIEG